MTADDSASPGSGTTVDDFSVYGSTSPSSNAVATAIRSLDQQEPERYVVEWAGETMEYDSTSYAITKIGFGQGGRPVIELEGGRGGKYVIDSNPQGRPLVRYLAPNGSDREERLNSITIYDTRFEWTHWIKRRIGL